MTGSEAGVVPADLGQDQDLFELASLYPGHTGLPMTVWVSPRGAAQHDARIKVCMTAGDRMDPDNLAVVAIRPQPHLLHGRLSQAELAAVQAWVALNETALLDYWDGSIDTVDLVQRLRKL
jgi:hypothetical protein